MVYGSHGAYSPYYSGDIVTVDMDSRSRTMGKTREAASVGIVHECLQRENDSEWMKTVSEARA